MRLGVDLLRLPIRAFMHTAINQIASSGKQVMGKRRAGGEGSVFRYKNRWAAQIEV